MDLQRCVGVGKTDAGKKSLVLVVDSNIDNLLLVEELLNPCCCSVMAATDGEQALCMIEKYQPDLILIEVMLPKIDGINVVQHLRQKGNTTPIIALTSLVFTKDLKRALRAGCNGYVKKPYEINELEATVYHYLHQQASPF
ncbi:MAG TPA: response regulator [Cyanobacteria bacterium UBA11372]|nr:response regulator [Cyanobacteria bacterium UBA11372]